MSDGSPKLISASRSKGGTSGSIALASRIAAGSERTKRPDWGGKGESRNGTIKRIQWAVLLRVGCRLSGCVRIHGLHQDIDSASR
jgi:hypothetical protein